MFSNNINLLAPIKFDNKLSLFIDCLHDFSTYNVVGGLFLVNPTKNMVFISLKPYSSALLNKFTFYFL